jgi:ABC-2 type transport system ATP-binding protein
VTVFLTTQYLEEADQLADRVGIINEGRMAVEGTPAALKAQVGNPHLEVIISDGKAEQAEVILARFGEPMPARDGVLMVSLQRGASDVALVVRALDEAGLSVESLNLVQPTLDDVFVEETGRHLEGAEPQEASDGPAEEEVTARAGS